MYTLLPFYIEYVVEPGAAREVWCKYYGMFTADCYSSVCAAAPPCPLLIFLLSLLPFPSLNALSLYALCS